jgi:hypothetical protein
MHASTVISLVAICENFCILSSPIRDNDRGFRLRGLDRRKVEAPFSDTWPAFITRLGGAALTFDRERQCRAVEVEGYEEKASLGQLRSFGNGVPA